MSEAASLFVIEDDTFVATERSRGPWDPRACHGGPVAALLVRACERVARGDDAAVVDWQLARITVELVRPVPVLEALRLATTVERSGRNVSLVGATLTVAGGDAHGAEVARARALRIRADDVALSGDYELEPPFSAAGTGVLQRPNWASEHVTFHRDSMEMRFVEGSWIDAGSVALWCRLLCPVIAGEEPTGAERAAAAADFSNGVSSELDPDDLLYINPDLTVHLLRPPEGEWIGMRARSFYGTRGAGLAEAALYDSRGRCGRSAQSLFIAPRR